LLTSSIGKKMRRLQLVMSIWLLYSRKRY